MFKFNLLALAIILLNITSNCFAEILENCNRIDDGFLCLSNNFDYKYSLNIDELNKNDISLINFDGCQYFFNNGIVDNICDKYKLKKNKENIEFIPTTKQFFTTIDFGYSLPSKRISSNIINGYSPLIGKYKSKYFYTYWTATKNNFKIKRNSIHVVCPVVNHQAIMSFKNNIKENFTALIDVRSSNNNVIPSPIIGINKELFIYFNKDKYINIDFPQSIKKDTVTIKYNLKNIYSISIKKMNNKLQLFIDNTLIYEEENILKQRQWTSFEIRIAAKSNSFYIDKLVIF